MTVQPDPAPTHRWSRALALFAIVVAAIPVVATVATFGELTIESFVAVVLAGAAIGAYGLARRTGSGSAPVGWRGLPWIAWLVALGVWEFLMFMNQPAWPTLSDLLDPLLANPVVRGLATLLWLGCGAWLVRRPAAASAIAARRAEGTRHATGEASS